MNPIFPSWPEFQRLARRYNVIPVRADVVLDRVTPVSVYEALSRQEPYAFLLESVEGGEHIGRYSFVGRRPRAIFECRDHHIVYREGNSEKTWVSQNPVRDMKDLFARFKAPDLPGLPRFWGGAVGYWDYDTVRYFERLPTTRPDRLGLPQGIFQLSGDLVIFDRFSQIAKVIANVFIGEKDRSTASLKRLYQQAVRSVQGQIRAIQRPVVSRPRKYAAQKIVAKPWVSKADYMHAVEKAKKHIRAGDIIQAVLSQRWEFEPHVSPFQIYRALRLLNPSPYMYYLHYPDMDIVGSSPELLVRKEGNAAETRPIAGTRRRGANAEEDDRLARDLRKDPKERAEHLMLVDLGRNDLGRVCLPGSVHVDEFMVIENYSHVMHLVSSVLGKLDRRANAFDLLQACFPAGTVSGAPKIRAMQIIDELELFRRGPYAGALGYFSYNGNMDMAITIRTLVFKGKKAYLQAGAGIVADSVPAREFAECEQKAAALVAAIQKAGEIE